MSTDRLIDRVRAADPAPTLAITDDELFARIVAQPGDARLVRARRHRRRIRWMTALVVAAVFGATGGAFGLGAFSHASPKALFEANPAGPFPWRPGQGVIVPVVIPQTVRLATTFTVSGVGRFQLWIALSRPKGWLCTAIRQPDGTWAGLPSGDKYQLAGPMPGCGTLGWQDVHGFGYWPSNIRSPAGSGGSRGGTSRPPVIRSRSATRSAARPLRSATGATSRSCYRRIVLGSAWPRSMSPGECARQTVSTRGTNQRRSTTRTALPSLRRTDPSSSTVTVMRTPVPSLRFFSRVCRKLTRSPSSVLGSHSNVSSSIGPGRSRISW